MPPKNATTGVEALDASSIQFLLSTIGACETFAPSWPAVADQNGIKYAKNARQRFNAIVAKLGYKLEGDKVVRLDQDGNNDKATTTAKPAKTAKPKKPVAPKKPKVENKEKAEEEEPEDDGDVKEESEEE